MSQIIALKQHRATQVTLTFDYGTQTLEKVCRRNQHNLLLESMAEGRKRAQRREDHDTTTEAVPTLGHCAVCMKNPSQQTGEPKLYCTVSVTVSILDVPQ